MTPFNFLLVLAVESCSIAGQIFFKHASRDEIERRRYLFFLGLGILFNAMDHFLWLGLQAKYAMSYLYPFEAISRLALLVAAWLFLKERATRQTLIGFAFIVIGVLLVADS